MKYSSSIDKLNSDIFDAENKSKIASSSVDKSEIGENSTPGVSEKENVIELNEINSIRLYSKIVKICSTMLTVLTGIYIWIEAYPLLATIIFTIFGYIGAHKYNHWICKFFTFYLLIIILEQGVILFVIESIGFRIVQFLVILIEILAIHFNAKLTLGLVALANKDYDHLINIS